MSPHSFRIVNALVLSFALAPIAAPAKIVPAPEIKTASATQSRASIAEEPNTRTERLIEFDAPGAATSVSPVCAGSFYGGGTCGTTAFSINDWGVSVGTFTDKNVVPHGFARDREGRLLVFDAPGAGLDHGLNEGTIAYAIIDRNTIHAFIRNTRDAFTAFDANGAGKGAGQGTIALTINARDETAGYYIDAMNVQDGFVRTHGVITSFDPRGSVGTYTAEESGLNDARQIAGFCYDANFIAHAFLRERDGRITQYSVTDGTTTLMYGGTFGAGITPGGTIAGNSFDTKSVRHGFVRFRSGKIVTFNAPTPSHPNIAVYSINRAYAIAGITSYTRGFERFSDGHVAVFTPRDAIHQPGATPFFGTRPSQNNA
jgi:hypothetical protein